MTLVLVKVQNMRTNKTTFKPDLKNNLLSKLIPEPPSHFLPTPSLYMLYSNQILLVKLSLKYLCYIYISVENNVFTF